jgi:hypothetical protein
VKPERRAFAAALCAAGRDHDATRMIAWRVGAAQATGGTVLSLDIDKAARRWPPTTSRARR